MRLKSALLLALGAALSAVVTLSGTGRKLSQLSELNEEMRTDLMFAEMDARARADAQLADEPLFVYRAGAAVPQGPYLDAEHARADAEALARQWPGTPIHVLTSANNVLSSDEVAWEQS